MKQRATLNIAQGQGSTQLSKSPVLAPALVSAARPLNAETGNQPSNGLGSTATPSRARMGGIVNLGQMLKIEVGINLRRTDISVAQ